MCSIIQQNAPGLQTMSHIWHKCFKEAYKRFLELLLLLKQGAMATGFSFDHPDGTAGNFFHKEAAQEQEQVTKGVRYLATF